MEWFNHEGKLWCTRACWEYKAHWKAIAADIRERIQAGARDIVVCISSERERGKNWLYICAATVREELADLDARYRGGAFESTTIGPCTANFYWYFDDESRRWECKDGTDVIFDPIIKAAETACQT